MGIHVFFGSALMLPRRLDRGSLDEHLKAVSFSRRSRRFCVTVKATLGDNVPRGCRVPSRIISADNGAKIRIRRGLEHLGIARVSRCFRELGKESCTRRIVKIMRFVPPGLLRNPAFAPPFPVARRSTLVADSVFRVA
jgi:hypothetical protein